MLERVREAISEASISKHFRELLSKDLNDPKYVAKLKRSYEGALQDGHVSNWRELYPDPPEQ
ncbi:MAG TPA: hypothetical protein VGA38_11690 [Candidatus Limnocylindria bacterium]